MAVSTRGSRTPTRSRTHRRSHSSARRALTQANTPIGKHTYRTRRQHTKNTGLGSLCQRGY
nr:MAG TPA: hypothetical protein [Microviridae sp.]